MSSQTIRPPRVLALVAVLAAFLALPSFAGATTYTMKWSRSVSLLNPNDGGGFDAVSCAPDVAGSTALLCAAGDVRGDVFVTEHPAQAAAQWHREYIDPKLAITGVSCPSAQLCVAVDAHGQVMHSTTPLAGAKTWTHPVRVDKATQTGGGYAGFASISCPTTTLCLAVDNAANGQVAYTTDPTGPASAWTLTAIGTGVTLDSVSCVSATFCMIGGTDGYFATAPTGGATAWKATTSLSASSSVIASISCATLKLCVGVGYGNAGAGLATGSSTPTTTTWSNSLIGSDPPEQNAQVVDSVACPARNFCVAVDGASNAYTSSTPVRGAWSAARPLKPKSQSTLSQVACNATICLEVDNRGTVTYGAVKGAAATTKTTTTGTTTTGTTTTKTTTGTTTTKTSTTG
jgi:hypothetical protein